MSIGCNLLNKEIVMILFGWGYKKIGDILSNVNCPNCNAQLVIIVLMNMFTLFWIPVFPISTKQYQLVCPSCGAAYPLDKANIDESLLSQLKTPWWAFSLLILFAVLIVLVFAFA